MRKKTDKRPTDQFTSGRLFQNDLDEINELLKQKFQSIIYIYKDYEYDSLDELKQHEGCVLTGLKINASDMKGNNSCELNIDFDFSVRHLIYLSATTDDCYSEFFSLQWLLRKKKMFCYPIKQTLGLFIFLLAYSYFQFRSIQLMFILVIFLTSIISLLWFFADMFRKPSKIYLYKKHEHTNFFTRNSDQIRMALLSTIISLIIGGILGAWIKDKIDPKRNDKAFSLIQPSTMPVNNISTTKPNIKP